MTVTRALRKVADAGADTIGQARHAGLLLAVLLLAGCPGTTGAPGAGYPDPSAMANRVAVPPVPRVKPAPPPVAPLATTTTSASAVAALPDPLATEFPAAQPTVQTASTQPSTPNADPDALVGLDEVQTLHLLGSPVAREEAPPAKVWRYAKGDCTLKVFFFMDMTSSQDFRALSYDMKSSPNVPDADHRCFAQLLAQAGAPGN
ncbi:hypothetical protein [Azospirillum doebereinerae]|uniref:Uncharacterized protein n=1 Tax=Azospirillum doebereinerae TaxID=92933 RepID=A0A3S0WIT2_9PROT|nr:hypothetical protein [Azospirillum doebereinerae]MCG5242519.1 hypothetical protein [Azospirillum doebereinerae]RUQ64541.1 hypothetical protein EJ913_26435 [Azospirillum doebereinerae]